MSQFLFLQRIVLKKNRVICSPNCYGRHEFRNNKITIKKSASDGSQSQGAISVSSTPLREKIKENTKTATYTTIIAGGVCVTAIMLWTIFRELFSSSSPNNVYSDTLKLVKEDYRVQDAIGTPIKGYGEESRRRRRQHVAHTMYNRNGIPHMRMQFHIQGLRNKATVHLEARENSSGKMEYRYLYVQLDYYPHTVIILEDNRTSDPLVEADRLNVPSTIPYLTKSSK